MGYGQGARSRAGDRVTCAGWPASATTPTRKRSHHRIKLRRIPTSHDGAGYRQPADLTPTQRFNIALQRRPLRAIRIFSPSPIPTQWQVSFSPPYTRYSPMNKPQKSRNSLRRRRRRDKAHDAPYALLQQPFPSFVPSLNRLPSGLPLAQGSSLQCRDESLHQAAAAGKHRN